MAVFYMGTMRQCISTKSLHCQHPTLSVDSLIAWEGPSLRQRPIACSKLLGNAVLSLCSTIAESSANLAISNTPLRIHAQSSCSLAKNYVSSIARVSHASGR